MKKIYLLTFVVPLILAGCGTSQTTSTTSAPTSIIPSSTSQTKPTFDADEFLSKMDTYGLHGLISATVEGQTATIENSVYVSDSEYYIKGISTGHFFKNSNGNVCFREVDNLNHVLEQEIEGPIPFTKETFNPFSTIVESDLSYQEGVVTIKVAEDNYSFAEVFTLQSGSVKSLEIGVDDSFTPVTFSMVLKDFTLQSTTYLNFSFDATFVSKEILGVPTYPYPAQGNVDLDSFFEKMQLGNYEFEVYSSLVDEGKTPAQTAIVTKDGALVRDVNYKNWGFVMDPNGGGLVEVEEIVGEKNFLRPTSSPDSSKTLETYVVPFTEFSTDLFTKTGNSYHLNNYMNVRRILPDATFSMNDQTMVKDSLDIELTATGATYTYLSNVLFGSGTYEMKVVVKNIGTTVFPYDLTDPTQYVTEVTCWADLLVGLDEFQLFEILGWNDLDELIPFFCPEGGYSYVDIWDGQIEFVRYVTSWSEGEQILGDFEWNVLLDLPYIPGTMLPSNFVEADDSDPFSYYYHYVNGVDGIQLIAGLQEGWFGDDDYFYIGISAYEEPKGLTVSVSPLLEGGTIQLEDKVYKYGDYVELPIMSTTSGLIPAKAIDTTDENTDVWIDLNSDGDGYVVCLYMPNHDVVLNATFGYKLSKASGLENGKILDLNGDLNCGHEEGEHIKLRLSPDSGYVPESASIVGHPEVNVTITTQAGFLGTTYFAEFDMPSFDATLTAVFVEE